jgi:hypothetical protein
VTVSGIERLVVSLKQTDVSEVRTASIIRGMNRPDDGKVRFKFLIGENEN